MGDKLLWKREPWRIYKTGNGRIRVDHGMRSDWPVLYTNTSQPWSVGWDSYDVPKDVAAKTKSILIKRELEK